MAGSRVVAARARLSRQWKEQQAALAAAVRAQEAVESARARARDLVAQGEILVAGAQDALTAAIAKLAGVMGSPELAAGVLDIDVAAARKATAAKTAAAVASRAATGRAPAVRAARPADAVEDARAL